MNAKAVRVLCILFLVFSLSCSFLSKSSPNEGSPAGPGVPSLVPSANGPQGLTAEATSADSVLLSWEPVEGATTYHIAVSTNGSAALTVVDLASSVTRYKDLMAAPDSQLTYAVEAVGDSGSIGQSVINVTTSARQPNPLSVQVKMDNKTSSAALIGAEGGSISVTDAKGVEYKLDIPAGALESQFNIVLTAVQEIGGMPLDGGMLAAVKIEPEGLPLADAATLSITLPNGLPDDKLSTLGFAFSGAGTEFHLRPAFEQSPPTSFVPQQGAGGHSAAPTVRRGKKTIIILPVMELKGNGAGRGSAANASGLVESNPPSDAVAALDQKQAAQAAEDDDLAPLIYPNPYASLLERAAFDVFNTIGKAQDCAETRSAVGSVTGWLWEAKFRNLDPAEIQRAHDTMVKDLSDKIKKVIDEAADKCKKQKGGPKKSAPPGTGCAKGLIRSVAAGSTQLFKDVQSQMIKDYGTDALNGPEGDLRACRKAYSVNAPVPSGSVSGNICDLEQVFTLALSGEVSGTFTFFPSNESSGRLQEQAEGAGVTFDGPGTYTISGTDSDSPVMQIDFAETAHTPLGDFTHDQTAKLPLDPLEAGACQP